jgi:hypothetical protein
MSVFTYEGRLYEVTEISPVDENGYHYECWDLTANSDGELGRIVVPEPDSGDSEIQVRLTRSIAASVLFRWMHFVPELRSRGIDPDEE